jgi:hypothetical protein
MVALREGRPPLSPCAELIWLLESRPQAPPDRNMLYYNALSELPAQPKVGRSVERPSRGGGCSGPARNVWAGPRPNRLPFRWFRRAFDIVVKLPERRGECRPPGAGMALRRAANRTIPVQGNRGAGFPSLPQGTGPLKLDEARTTCGHSRRRHRRTRSHTAKQAL